MFRDHLGNTPSRIRPKTAVLAAIGVAAAVILVTAAADRFARGPDPRDKRLAAAGLLFPFAAPHAPGLKPSAPGGGLLGEKASGEPALSFEEFMGYLEDVAQEPALAPVAARFVKDFKQEPELKAVYDDAKRRLEAGKKPSAGEFVAALRGNPKFRFLVSQYLGNPQTTALLAGSRHPELAQLAREAAAVHGPPGGRDPRPGGSRSAAASPAVSEGRGAGGASPGRPGQGQPTAYGGGPTGHAPAGFAAPGGDPAVADRPASPRPAAHDPRGSGAHALATIKDLREVKTKDQVARALDKYPFLEKNFTPGELAKLAEDIDRHGLWGACFENRWFTRCVEACRDGVDASGKRVCQVPDGWAACMDGLRDEGRCLELCMSQAPCTPDRAVVRSHCEDPSRQPPPPYCAPKPAEPAPAPGGRALPTGLCAQEAFGVCCFDEAGFMVQAVGSWPQDKTQCSGPFGLVRGVCKTITLGVCCWEEASNKILYRNHDRACDGAGPLPCGAPVCCREIGGKRCCFDGKEGKLLSGPAACLEEPRAPVPSAPGPVVPPAHPGDDPPCAPNPGGRPTPC